MIQRLSDFFRGFAPVGRKLPIIGVLAQVLGWYVVSDELYGFGLVFFAVSMIGLYTEIGRLERLSKRARRRQSRAERSEAPKPVPPRPEGVPENTVYVDDPVQPYWLQLNHPIRDQGPY